MPVDLIVIDLIRSRFDGVVVKRYRLSRNLRWRIERDRMTVKALLVRIKDYQSIEHGRDRFYATLKGFIPKLQVSAILGPPILVQVEQDIDPPVHIQWTQHI